MEMQNVVIVDGARSAFARGGRGAFTATRLDTIGVQVLQELLGRYPQLSPHDIEDVGMGCVGGVTELAGIGANHIVRLAGLPESVCTFDSTAMRLLQGDHAPRRAENHGRRDRVGWPGRRAHGPPARRRPAPEPTRITRVNQDRHK